MVTFYLVARLCGRAAAEETARDIEYAWVGADLGVSAARMRYA